MIDVNFEGLFSVEILHKYFNNGLCPSFSITPSNNTLNVIKGHKMVVKQYHNKLYAGIQSAAAAPFIPVEQGMQLTFFLWLNDPLFFNFTNLPAGFNSTQIFYFTNRNNTVVNGKNLLSEPIIAYSNSVFYTPGDLATDVTGIVYRAIKTNNNTDQHALSETDYWAAIDNNSYTSANDALQFLPALSTYNFTIPQANAVVTALAYNSVTNDYTLPVLADTINFITPATSFVLDLSTLTTGKYSLTVNGTQQWIYVSQEISGRVPFGIIDIYNAASPASCNLLSNGVLASPLYSINFLNRATLWKYVLPTGRTGLISDNNNVYNFTTAANDITSTAPIPLTDQLLDFKLTIGTTPFTPIPCADAQRLTSIVQAIDTYACSEIYINY